MINERSLEYWKAKAKKARIPFTEVLTELSLSEEQARVLIQDGNDWVLTELWERLHEGLFQQTRTA